MFNIHRVKCYYCGKTFDRDKLPFTLVGKKRYAHQECSEANEKEKTQEEKDKEQLEEYIKQLFSADYIVPRVQKQIKQYKEEYNYTYTGMKKALSYFYEIKNGDIEKANGGIGIIPYIYNDAFNYYYSIWEANQKNELKFSELNDLQNQHEDVITIKPPKRKKKKRKLFMFLEVEGE